MFQLVIITLLFLLTPSASYSQYPGSAPELAIDPVWSGQRKISVDRSPTFFHYRDRAKGDKLHALQALDHHVRTSGTGRCIRRAVYQGIHAGGVFDGLPNGQSVFSISCTGDCRYIKYGIARNRSSYVYHRGLAHDFPQFLNLSRTEWTHPSAIGLAFFQDIPGRGVISQDGRFVLPPGTVIVVEVWSYTIGAWMQEGLDCSHAARR